MDASSTDKSDKTRLTEFEVRRPQPYGAGQELLRWWPEAASLTVSLGAVLAIIVVIAHYDGKLIPSWHGATINAVISVLSVAAQVAMTSPIASGLGQLKWTRFSDERRPRRVGGFEAYDAASRSAWGSLKLVISPALW